jgi:CelD/BcsL family acetyltransferase involved in cellulose biosynthesis
MSEPSRGLIANVERERAALPVGELTADIVVSVEGIRALKPDYELLYRLTDNTLPFALQDWHLAWCERFLNRDAQIRDRPRFYVLRDSAGACVAIVPLIFSRRRLGPLKLGMLDFIGSDPGLTEIPIPLIQPGYERLTVRAVHESLATVRDWDWIQWTGISGALAEAMALEIEPEWHEIKNDYLLDLPSSWEEFHAGLKRNIRESLRHCYNSLKRDGHAFELVVARAPGEIRQALDRFLTLHAMRANMAWGRKHPNRFSSRASQEFLYDVCERLAARGAVRVFQLKIGPEIVASRIGFVVGDSVYLYYSGFNPAWARYSVMTTTVAEALKYAIANRLKTVNLSLTAEQSKLRWRPRLVEFHSASVPRDSLGSRIAYRAYREVVSGGGRAGRLLMRLGWFRRDWN